MEKTCFQKIEEIGIIPVICPADQTELNVLLDAIADTDVRVIEITLRNEFSTTAIKYIKENHPELTVGAGTVNTEAKLEDAIDCGADFLVAPGIAEFAHKYVKERGITFIHGVATPSEILHLYNLGYRVMKLFPAEISGGTRALTLYASAFSDVRFIPTGGITVENLGRYLECKNVLGCGGSFMVPKALLTSGDSAGIRDLIKKLCRR